MELRNIIAGLLLCTAFHVALSAENELVGIVADESGNPVEFANVALMSQRDSTLVDGVVTDLNGRFSLRRSDKPCFLQISALGFEQQSIIFHPDENVGVVKLVPTAYGLEEVVIEGASAMLKSIDDGLQVRVSDTYLAVSGTAFDVLSKMPFVINNGNQMEVLGKGTPIVFINGRQVRDQSELNRLSSAEIKNVDIVTSPGARYDASVNAVIRITTKSPVGEGVSLNNRTTVGYKHYAYLFQQVNLNYRKAGFDVFGMLNYENYRDRLFLNNSMTQYLKSGVVDKIGNAYDLTEYPVYQGKIGVNYSAAKHNFGAYYDFSYRPSESVGNTQTSRCINDTWEELHSDSEINRHNRQHLLSTYYTVLVGKWQLSANFDAVWQINDRFAYEKETSSENADRRAFSASSNIESRLIAGNVNASVPMWNGNLRFGTEVSNMFLQNVYYSDADFILDSDVKIQETTYALFAETTQTFERASVSAGLRWEFTASEYILFGEKQSEQSRKYHNLAPSVSVSFPFGSVSARVSYTRKTTRPAFEQLSSSIKYVDRYSYESGNPQLKPIYRDYISLTMTWNDLAVNLDYHSTKNYFMWQTSQYPGNEEATLLKMENMPRFDTWGAFVNYSPLLFNIWRPTLMAGVMLQDFKLLHNGEIKRMDKPLGTFRLNNAVHLPLDFWLNVDFAMRTSGNGDNAYLKSFWTCNIGLYKSFAGDRWNVKLQINDVFDTMKSEFITYDAISRVSVSKQYDTRDISLTIRYNFNAVRSRYRGIGAGNAEKSRF